MFFFNKVKKFIFLIDVIYGKWCIFITKNNAKTDAR
jgi:hypothetical protein